MPGDGDGVAQEHGTQAHGGDRPRPGGPANAPTMPMTTIAMPVASPSQLRRAAMRAAQASPGMTSTEVGYVARPTPAAPSTAMATTAAAKAAASAAISLWLNRVRPLTPAIATL